MKIKILDYYRLNAEKLTVKQGEDLIYILGLDLFLQQVGISRVKYAQWKCRANERGTFSPHQILAIFVFLKDNSVSDDEIKKVLGVGSNI